jgi:uncharacterized protein YcgI (DUF1989 family)
VVHAWHTAICSCHLNLTVATTKSGQHSPNLHSNVQLFGSTI